MTHAITGSPGGGAVETNGPDDLSPPCSIRFRDDAREVSGGEVMPEITVADMLAWLRSRPGASWKIAIRDVEKAVAALSVTSQERA